MVKKFFLPVVIFFLLTRFLPAQDVSFGGKFSFGTAYLHLTDSESDAQGVPENTLVSNGLVQLLMTVTSGTVVRAYFGGTVSDYACTDISGNAVISDQKSESLDKAYIKLRFPWFTGQRMRLSLGKMPLSWGYGVVFNAGDIVFGPEPESFKNSETVFSGGTESSLSDLRTSTDWIVNASVPLLDGKLAVEPVAVLPLESGSAAAVSGESELYSALADSGSTLSGRSGYPRAGGRIMFMSYLEQIETVEAGYLTDFTAAEQQFYAAADGNLYVDYNLCAAFSLFKDSLSFTGSSGTEKKYTPSEQTKECTMLSLGLSKIFSVAAFDAAQAHTLSLRAETLYYPFSGTVKICTISSFSFTPALSSSVTWLFTRTSPDSLAGQASSVQEYIHLLALNLEIIPAGSFTVNAAAVLPDIQKAAGIQELSLSCTYRF
ncbi:MAG: hypothetical protein M0P01_10445 [Treponema sp.]|nr:hypothetical protein [Treponema sp.]